MNTSNKKNKTDKVIDDHEQLIDHAKKAIKKTYESDHFDMECGPEPEMAFEVLNENMPQKNHVEHALVAEHLFRIAIESAIPVGIAGFDIHLKQIYTNQVFCTMLGYDESELINTAFPQEYWAAGTDKNKSRDIYKILEDISSSKSAEVQFRRKNGEMLWGLVICNALLDSSGELIGRLISVADISTQKYSENTLRLLSAKLINTQESERKHLAQDLHDSIGGKLTGLKYGLEGIMSQLAHGQNDIAAMLQDMVSSIRSTLDETQRIIKNLHPSILDDLGLIPAIRDYCREFKQFYPWITINAQLDIHHQNVPESITILLYRFLQEAMNNVAKHSEADAVKITIKTYTDKIELVIQDNGKGFDIEKVTSICQPSGGLGLQSMKERTELFGGKLLLQSRMGKGTSVSASWPL